MIYEDQLAAVKRDSVKVGTTGAGEIDLALLTDGLKAEREQGITIDVAYRYFSTDKRKFIIADTPGHEQYTRNMATGASTCQLAIILIDARHGVMTQTRRHSFIVSLLGIKHVVVAINKMDLVGYSQRGLRADQGRLHRLRRQARPARHHLHPDVGAEGRQRRRSQSDAMPWYSGPPLLDHLETVHIASDRNLTDLRFPVQYVIRPNLDFRGFAGTVASGILRKGDEVMVLPSGKRSRVKSIVTYDGELEEAFAPHGGDGHADRRDGRQPRRHAGAAGQPAARQQPDRGDGGVDGRAAVRARPDLHAEAHHAAGDGGGRVVPLRRRRQHPGAPGRSRSWG